MDDSRWYALRAFRNRTQTLMQSAQEAGHRVYYADCLSNIFFIKCPIDWLKEFKHSHLSDFSKLGVPLTYLSVGTLGLQVLEADGQTAAEGRHNDTVPFMTVSQLFF